MNEEFARTGCHLLDIFFGGGAGLGIPYGNLVNLCGASSSGKSLMGNEIIAAEHHRRKALFKHEYDDAENGNQFDTTEMFAYDIMGNNLLKKHPNAKKMKMVSDTVEDLDSRTGIFLDMLKPNEYGIYFADSLDAMTSEENQKRHEDRAKQFKKGESLDEGTYGMASARFLSQEFFKNMGAKVRGKKALIIIISQVRDIIGAGKYQKKERTTGGRAKKHWMGIEAWFKPICKLKNAGSDLVNGIYFEVSGVKTRDGRIERSCRFLFYTDYGIDDIGSSIDYLFDLRDSAGKLRASAAKAIPWDAVGKPKEDLDGVTAWLNLEKGRLEAYRTWRNELDGKKNIAASMVQVYSQSSPELTKAYEDHFGKTYTRDELHLMCRQDPKLKKELDKRVTKKWEDLEAAAKSGLGRKYG